MTAVPSPRDRNRAGGPAGGGETQHDGAVDAALETLSVVAYKQPVSRARVSAIRGVNVDGVIRTLMSRGLIEDVGADADTGGLLYRTTDLFLERLGLSDLSELPSLGPLLPDMIDTKLRDLARTATVVRVERDRGTMRWLAAAALVVAGVLVGAALG